MSPRFLLLRTSVVGLQCSGLGDSIPVRGEWKTSGHEENDLVEPCLEEVARSRRLVLLRPRYGTESRRVVRRKSQKMKTQGSGTSSLETLQSKVKLCA
jgi:hypothetical protein